MQPYMLSLITRCLFTEVTSPTMSNPSGFIVRERERDLGFAGSLIKCKYFQRYWLVSNVKREQRQKSNSKIFSLWFWSGKKRIKGTETMDKPVCRWRVGQSQWPVQSHDGVQNNTSCPLHACVCIALFHHPSFSSGFFPLLFFHFSRFSPKAI